MRRRRVYQFVPNLLEGDATADNCLAIHHLLESHGYESRIFANAVHPGVGQLASPLAKLDVPDLLLYHFAGPFDLLEEAATLPCRRGMIYHNVTPAEFYDPYDPDAAAMCRRGRDGLASLRKYFHFALTVSAYNRRELESRGFPRIRRIPLVIDWSKYPPPESEPPDGIGEVLRILFVGRMVPNKKVEDLLEVLARLQRLCPGGVSLQVVGEDWLTFRPVP
jgi:glycosyltransferase involved in cell wall biosynthesis